MKIVKQYIFYCSRYWESCGNCVNCTARAITVVAESKEEAIEKYRKIGGKVDFEKDRILPPDMFCELMNFFE